MSAFSPKQSQAPQRTPSNTTSHNAPARSIGHQEHPILNLQRTIGNQAVLRLLQAEVKASEAGAAASHPRFKFNFASIPVSHTPVTGIQRKLTVNEPGDAYEQEADRVAEQVMRMPAPGAAATPAVSGGDAGVQRKCVCGGNCDDCKKKKEEGKEHKPLQMKPAEPASLGGMEAPPIVHDVLLASGQPLDTATRAFMEPRFGHDFSKVRVHTNAKAAESAGAVQAKAYTVGQDVVFGAGAFAPGTQEGQRLLGHELTHVVQQGSGRGRVQRESDLIPAPPLSDVVDEALRGPREYKPPLNISDRVLKEEDGEFTGPNGELFKKRVEEAAAKVGLDAGLLAASLLAEWSRDDAFTKKSGKENTAKVGADDYLEKEEEIRNRIPAAQEVRVSDAGDAETFKNEEGRVIRRGKFDATKAVLVGAIYLKHGELKVRDALARHGVDFDSLTPELRFAFTRLAMNPGKEPVDKQIERFLLTRDIADTAPGILIRTGVRKQDRRKPQSGATLVAARGLHLSQKVFGNVYEPSSQSLVPKKETPLKSRIELEE